jgi:hypothetical protein
MTTDFRALCAELVEELERYRPLQEVPDCLERARAALARWGRPTPQPIPVSERLPVAGDCDGEGQ